MLNRKFGVEIMRYSVGEWIIDVSIDYNETLYEAYLRHKFYGVADLMFGIPFFQGNNEYCNLPRFLELVEANLENYIEIYTEEHMTEAEE